MLGKAKVFDVLVPLERNDQPFLTIHVGVRTTFLRQAYHALDPGVHLPHGLCPRNRAAGRASAQQSRPAAPGRDQQATRLLDVGRRKCRGGCCRTRPRRTRRPGCPPRSSRSASACATWRRSSPRLRTISTRFWAIFRTASCCLLLRAARCWCRRRRGVSCRWNGARCWACTHRRSSTGPRGWARHCRMRSIRGRTLVQRGDSHRDGPADPGIRGVYSR